MAYVTDLLVSESSIATSITYLQIAEVTSVEIASQVLSALVAITTAESSCPAVTRVVTLMPLDEFSSHLHNITPTLSVSLLCCAGHQAVFVPLFASASLPDLVAFIAELSFAETPRKS